MVIWAGAALHAICLVPNMVTLGPPPLICETLVMVILCLRTVDALSEGRRSLLSLGQAFGHD